MRGRLEVITGPMFSGKTTELLRRIRRAEIAEQVVHLWKHGADDRYAVDEVVSHAGHRKRCTDILEVEDADVVVFDEAQFYDPEDIVTHALQLVRDGVRVIVAGLDMDSDQRPFGPMPLLMAYADEVVKLKAICAVCKGDANLSYRKVTKGGQVLVGGAEAYEPRCRACMDVD